MRFAKIATAIAQRLLCNRPTDQEAIEFAITQARRHIHIRQSRGTAAWLAGRVVAVLTLADGTQKHFVGAAGFGSRSWTLCAYRQALEAYMKAEGYPESAVEALTPYLVDRSGWAKARQQARARARLRAKMEAAA